ncbi:MAG: glycosyltransferase family 2 protein [Treponema sp.]|nr:glycosyltransferase family 2 protein [Treponema sp.]
MPEISLITATYGRTAEIPRLLDSLVRQSFKDFELIIVDQNEHDEVAQIVQRYAHTLSISYIKSAKKGLSLNRNLGLDAAHGQIYAFPDDDCFYDDTVLQCVHEAFSDASLKYLCFDLYDDVSNNFCWKRVDRVPVMKRRRVYYNGNSINFFIRANPHRFDENLGVGTKFGSGEETDYLLQNIAKDDKGRACLEANIYHNAGQGVHITNEKYYKYALGFGAMCKKDVVARKSVWTLLLFAKYVLRACAGLLLKKDKKLHWLGLKGRVGGFISYKVKR